MKLWWSFPFNKFSWSGRIQLDHVEYSSDNKIQFFAVRSGSMKLCTYLTEIVVTVKNFLFLSCDAKAAFVIAECVYGNGHWLLESCTS